MRKGGAFAGDPPEEHTARLIGDSRRGVDRLRCRRFSQQAHERRPRFRSADSTKRARGGNSHLAAGVDEEIDKRVQDRSVGPGAAAGMDPDLWVRTAEQFQRRVGRKRRLEACRGCDREGKRRALHYSPDENSNDRLRCFSAVDVRKRIQCRDLFGHQTVASKADESLAKLLERRNGGLQPSARRLFREQAAVGNGRVGDCGDKRLVGECRGVYPNISVWSPRMGARNSLGKKVKLSVGHQRTLRV